MSRRILLVEDNPANQMLASAVLQRDGFEVADADSAGVDLVSSFLESRGYQVATALDGNRAVELGSTGDYALAILDVHMPMYEGVEVLQILRRRHVLHPMRIIALTGDATEQ